MWLGCDNRLQVLRLLFHYILYSSSIQNCMTTLRTIWSSKIQCKTLKLILREGMDHFVASWEYILRVIFAMSYSRKRVLPGASLQCNLYNLWSALVFCCQSLRQVSCLYFVSISCSWWNCDSGEWCLAKWGEQERWRKLLASSAWWDEAFYNGGIL